MAIPKIRSIAPAVSLEKLNAEADRTELRVGLEDGGYSSFIVATPDDPRRIIAEGKDSYFFGAPSLFVRRLDPETIGEAVEAMAIENGGFWLRYYRSLEETAPKPAKKRGKKK